VSCTSRQRVLTREICLGFNLKAVVWSNHTRRLCGIRSSGGGSGVLAGTAFSSTPTASAGFGGVSWSRWDWTRSLSSTLCDCLRGRATWSTGGKFGSCRLSSRQCGISCLVRRAVHSTSVTPSSLRSWRGPLWWAPVGRRSIGNSAKRLVPHRVVPLVGGNKTLAPVPFLLPLPRQHRLP
jgi:hypothetical protein